jgi:cytochrome b561
MHDLTHTPGYTGAARTLHWITALLVLAMIPLGLVIAEGMGGSWQAFLYDLHKSLGVIVLLVAILRWLYRLGNKSPPLPAELPKLQQMVAHVSHWALYVLILVQPLVGWAATASYPAPVPIFGLFDLPSIWPVDRALSERLFQLHGVLGFLMAVLATLHIAATLHHHFVRRDRILMRMLKG